MRFVFEGKVNMGKEWRKFRKEVEGKSKGHALQKLYGLFGSLNGLKRSQVKVENIKEVEAS